MSSEYAQAGVDYTKIEPFKRAMIEVGRTTLKFPNKRNVFVEVNDHGATYEYRGPHEHMWSKTQEGLGNKNWIAEWMYESGGIAQTHYESIGIDAAMMAVNDVIAQGAMPVIYTDEVAAGDSEWFTDEKRAKDLARGYYRACEMAGMALPAGESPSLKYLVKAAPPVKSAPSLSGCVTGIIAPKYNLIKGNGITAGDHIIGVTSSGVHANGISLIIKKAMELPNRFYTPVPGGRTLGEEVLTPTRCYVALVEMLLEREIEIHTLLPGTGGGIAKIAFDKRPFTYHIHSWPEDIPPIFPFIRDVLRVPLLDCLTTFNWGIGYYLFVPAKSVVRTMDIGEACCDLEMIDLGMVTEGERKVIFSPEDITLPPPGE